MLFLSSYYGFSQQYPVQVTTTLAPPYSLYLSDYTAIGSNNLQVLVNLLELDRPNLQIKFRITIEGAGITLRTNPTFMPRPLNIQGGVPELFTGADLTSYFNPDHLDFTGITRAAFKRSGQLPEGFYTFTLEVLEYNRNVRISNQSISYAWIVLNDPPLLNTPFNGDKLIATDPQNIMFSWTPRHTASPNAAFSTEYEFRLVELYPGQTNPDIAIRSSNSIYTTTTNLTSLNYGIIEPTLIPGKRYAFRVRAYDTSGRDLFKNDGYSETYVFQYGDDCRTFEGIAAKTLDPQRARISWEPEQHHTGGVINYRKKGKEEWFTQDVNGSYGIVSQLAGRTTYEYQLTPQCGTILGEKSPMMTFTTPEVDESGFVCGAPIPEFDASDIPLMKPLLPLDVIQVGDWTVNLLNVSANGDGTYGGAGYAAVPNFNLANVRVVFDKILVNEDYQVVAGDIKTVYSEDSRFVLDIKKKEEETEVVEESGAESPDADLTEDMVADILTVNIEGDIGEVIFSGGLLEIYDEAGNLIEDTDLDLPPEGEELTITDSNGDTWVVDSEGGVREVQGGESSTPESSEVDVIVQFTQTEESNYGFDAYDADIPQLRHFYQNVLTINDEEYVPAWKSVPVGMPDQVIAVANENEFPENMMFRSSTLDLEPMAGQQDNEKHLSVIGKAHGDIDVIEAYQSIEEEENVAGRINVVSYEKIYKKLEIVPVNGASIGDINIIGDRINKIFQQAAVEWKVEAAEPFMVDPKLLVNFDEGESGMLASFPDKMQQFNREFKRSRPVDKETYYIFVINEGSASLSGFMPFKRQFGYVFTRNTSYTDKTIAHELAHGAFRLRHTFSSAYGIPQRSTDNLMDYNGDLDKLKKFQWDLIHDPENLVGWFEDDEESALTWNFFSEKYTQLFNHVYSKNHLGNLHYWDKIKKAKDETIDLDYDSEELKDWLRSWKIRVYTKEDVYNNVIKAVKEANDGEKISQIVLRPKHIYLGQCEYEGRQYPYAIYRDYDGNNFENESATLKDLFTKIQVTDIRELSNTDNINHIYSDETFSKYLIIGLVEEGKKKPTVIIQIEKFLGDETLVKWLEYLNIYKPEPSVFYALKEEVGKQGREFIIQKGEELRRLSDFFSTKSIDEIQSQIAIYEDGYSNFNKYLEEARKNDYNLDSYPGWSIRKSSFTVNNNLTLIERVIKKLIDEVTGFGLHEKGIFLGKYELEGTEYNMAVYSENATVNPQKVRVGSLSELSDNAPIRVGIKENYILIAFLNNSKNLDFVIQIDHGSIETAKLWLKYLGILVEDQSWLESVVIPYWDKIFGSDRYENILLSDVGWYSQFDDQIGCSGGGCCWYACNYIYNKMTGKIASQNDANNIAVLSSPDNYFDLTATSNFDVKLKYLENQIVENGSPVVIGVHYYKSDKPYNENDATRHFLVVVGKGYDVTKKQNFFQYYEVGTGIQYEYTRGRNEGNKLYVDKENRKISGYRGYDDRFYTVTEIR